LLDRRWHAARFVVQIILKCLMVVLRDFGFAPKIVFDLLLGGGRYASAWLFFQFDRRDFGGFVLDDCLFPGSDMRCPGADVEILKTKAKLSPELAKERCQTV
jgi:hypothetical protein